jgi:hypothetical protein
MENCVEALRGAKPQGVIRQGVAGAEDSIKGQKVTCITGNFTPTERERKRQEGKLHT